LENAIDSICVNRESRSNAIVTTGKKIACLILPKIRAASEIQTRRAGPASQSQSLNTETIPCFTIRRRAQNKSLFVADSSISLFRRFTAEAVTVIE
jgi:hypothetical protein